MGYRTLMKMLRNRGYTVADANFDCDIKKIYDVYSKAELMHNDGTNENPEFRPIQLRDDVKNLNCVYTKTTTTVDGLAKV